MPDKYSVVTQTLAEDKMLYSAAKDLKDPKNLQDLNSSKESHTSIINVNFFFTIREVFLRK